MDKAMMEARDRLDDSVLPEGVTWSRCRACFDDPSTPLCAGALASKTGCMARDSREIKSD